MTPPSAARPPALSGRAARLAVGAATALGAALRLWQLGRQPLWLDEASTWRFARHDSLWAIITSEPVHPPLNKLLVAAWMRALGESEWSLRLLPALLGVALIPASAALCQAALRLHAARCAHSPDDARPLPATLTRWWPAATAGMVAVSPFLIAHSQELRMYALLALLSVGFWWALITWTRTGARRHAALVAAACVLGLHTHHFFLFTALGGALTLARRGWQVGWGARAPRRALADSAWITASAAACFAPWALHVVTHYQAIERSGGALFGAIPYALYRFAIGDALMLIDSERMSLMWRTRHVIELGASALAIVACALLAWSGARALRGRRALADLILGALVAPMLIVWLLVHPWSGLLLARYMIATAPAFLALLALGWLAAPGRAARAALAGAWALLTVTALLPYYGSPGRLGGFELRYGKEAWREAAAVIGAAAGADDRVLLSPGYLHLPYDYYDRGAHPPRPLDPGADPEPHIAGVEGDVWLIVSHPWDDDRAPRALLALGLDCAWARRFPAHWGLRVLRFTPGQGRALAPDCLVSGP